MHTFLRFLAAWLLTTSPIGAQTEYPTGLLHPIPTETVSPDGAQIAVRQPRRWVTLLHRPTRDRLSNIKAGTATVPALAFAPDGEQLAIVCEKDQVCIWQWKEYTWKPLDRPFPKTKAHALCFSPDGRFLAIPRISGGITLFLAKTGKEGATFEGSPKTVRAMAFSPDGRLLAALADDRVLRVWEIASGVEIWKREGTPSVGRLAFDAKSRILHHADPSRSAVSDYAVRGGKFLGRRRLLRLSLEPDEIVLRPGEQKATHVVAYWSDGSVQKVGSESVFQSTDDEVASVAADGTLTGKKPGRCVVQARYFGRAVAGNVFLPFDVKVDSNGFEPRGTLDAIVRARWRKLGVQPAKPVSDAVFLRRTSLTLIGRPPTPDEVRAFLHNEDPFKRVALIDALLSKPDYAKHWANHWAEQLEGSTSKKGSPENAGFRKWMQQQLSDTSGFDRTLHEILIGKKLGDASPLGTTRDATETAKVVAQAFLGVDLQCAMCHPAPGQAWGPDPIARFAAIFEPGDEALAPYAVPGHSPFGIKSDENRRQAFARWLTENEESPLARVLVNRYWAELFGEGLTDSDEVGVPAEVALFPELLDFLAKDLVAHNYDVKRLLRVIANSSLFALDKQPPHPENDPAIFLGRRVARRVPSPILLEIFEHIVGEPLGTSEKGFMAVHPSSGEPPSLCPHLRARTPTFTPSALILGSSINEKTFVKPRGILVRLLASGKTNEEITEELVLLTLSRYPNDQEKTAIRKLFNDRKTEGRQRAFVDVLWALTNTREFLFIP